MITVKWPVLVEHSVDDGRVHVLVPQPYVAVDAETIEQAIEQARTRIVANHVWLLTIGLGSDRDDSLPVLDTVEVPVPTEAEIVAKLESDACDIQDAPISLSAVAARYGLSVFAVHRAVVADRLQPCWRDHPDLFYDYDLPDFLRPSGVERYLAERADRKTRPAGPGRPAGFWRKRQSRPIFRRRG